jgi:hypothetical protein
VHFICNQSTYAVHRLTIGAATGAAALDGGRSMLDTAVQRDMMARLDIELIEVRKAGSRCGSIGPRGVVNV